MITFFHSPQPQTLAKDIRFPEISLRGSERNKRNGIIPFSHLYLTTASQFGHLARSEKSSELVKLPEATGSSILQHVRCPLNASFAERGLSDLLADSALSNQDTIKLCILNGMGRGFGDNVAGLAALQRLRVFLSSRFKQVEIDLMQRNTTTQSLIYQRYDAADQIKQLPVSVTEFFSYDAYVDITDLLSIPQFHDHTLYDFFIAAVSMQKEVGADQPKAAKLQLQPELRHRIRKSAVERSKKRSCRLFKKHKLVLFHPSASSKLRCMPNETIERIMPAVLKKSKRQFVTCVPLEFKHKNLIDLSDLSTDINCFFDIIASCDAVISVGTVAYHVSGSFDIPTLLIPTVNADVESSACLPSVECHLPEESRQHLSDLHMSKREQDIEAVRPIWDNLQPDHIIQFLKRVL